MPLRRRVAHRLFSMLPGRLQAAGVRWTFRRKIAKIQRRQLTP